MRDCETLDRLRLFSNGHIHGILVLKEILDLRAVVARKSRMRESMFVSRLEISSLKVRPSSFSHGNEQIRKLAVSRKPSSWASQNEIKIVYGSPEEALLYRAANSDLATKH